MEVSLLMKKSILSPRAMARIILPLLVAGILLIAGLPQQAQAVSRGIVDARLERVYPPVDLKDVPSIVAEMGPGRLQARWTRVMVSWARLQPEAPGAMPASEDQNGDGYSDSYVTELDTVVGALRAARMTVIMTGSDVPEWASDARYWTSEGYNPSVAMRIDNAAVRAQFSAFAQFLASRFAHQPLRVRYFEVWNEPNLGSGIYPQWKGKKAVGPRVYFKMLKAFRTGAKRGSSRAFIIAGATAPRGTSKPSLGSTSPQKFARYLKARHANRWFNGYSHHPYTPGGSRRAAPNRLPNNPSRCVTLANLDVLMKLFPGKPFYLTEFGYNTQYSKLFGLKVSAANQARYLRQAYAMVKRMKRVKALLWFLVVDWKRPDGTSASDGAYCGLIKTDRVTRKPAWYAFSGGNRLSMQAPRSVKRRATFSVSGTLTTRLGPGASTKVMLQRRSTSRGTWSRVARTVTGSDGAYSFRIREARTKLYRVVWDGVCVSVQKKVRAR